MQRRRMYYRTKDGRADYRFSFERQPGGTWRIYIEWQTPYGDRDRDFRRTHRQRDGDRTYVCWTKAPRRLEEAKEIAALWADKTQEYIQTGRPF